MRETSCYYLLKWAKKNCVGIKCYVDRLRNYKIEKFD
jgi:hypothetical protein